MRNIVKEDLQWLFIKLYTYAEINEVRVLKIIRSIVVFSYKKKYISKFFFIRYGDPEKHFRLRFEMTGAATKHESLEIIKNALSRAMIKAKYIFDKDYRIEVEDYIPEINRYGGANLMSVAEEQFSLSSRVVLSAYSENVATTSYQVRLGIGLQFHVIFLKCYELNGNELIMLTDGICDSWIQHHINQSPKLVDSDKMDIMVKFNNQTGSDLMNYLDALLESHQTGGADLRGVFDIWYDENLEIAKKVKLGVGRPDAYIDNMFLFNDHSDFDRPTKYIHSIISSYMHMTNNRLGIVNLDEAYLAFIMNKYFRMKQT